MPRLFVAIDLSTAIKQQLGALQAATHIPKARWAKPEQMHLTLRFIGADLPEEQVEPIKSALATVQAERFELQVGGVGRFPPSPKKAPRVIWVGTKEQPSLHALQQKVERTLAEIGFKPEKKPFNAHITLARLKTHKPTPEADAFLKENAYFHAGTQVVREFILYNSVLSPQGPRYNHDAIYPLHKGS